MTRKKTIIIVLGYPHSYAPDDEFDHAKKLLLLF